MPSYSIISLDGSHEEYIDHEDGTATHSFYGPSGTIISTDNITGLPLPAPLPLSERMALLGAPALEHAVNLASELDARKNTLSAAVTSEDPQTATAVLDEAVQAASISE